MALTILQNCGGIALTNSFLLVDPASKKAALFDAPNDTTGPLLDAVAHNGWTLEGLWLTHGHFDHLADHARVTQRFPNARIIIHRLEEPKLSRPQVIFPLPFKIPPGKADLLVEDGQMLAIGDVPVQVIHTPGHSVGSVVYYIPSEKLLVGGDLIIGGSIGRTDLPDSNSADMRQSLKKVLDLPDDTRLLPGHGPMTTLLHELQTNCYVQEAVLS